MEELLRQMVGKRIDVTCGGGAAFGGEVSAVADGVLQLKDDEGVIAYVSVKKIAFFVEKGDSQPRPGFIL